MSQELEPEGVLSDVLSAVSLIGFVVLVVLLLLGAIPNLTALSLWGFIALAIALLLVGLGFGAANKWYGVIVEKDRRRASLSRLQITLWTIMIISAFLSIAFTRTLRPTPEASAEEIAACQADYVADHYGIDLADLKGEVDTEMAEETSEAIADGNEALDEATDELAKGMAALEEAVAEVQAGDTEEVLEELDDLRETVSEAQEDLDAASESLTEASTELDAVQEETSEPEKSVTLEQALDEAEEECTPHALNIKFPQEILLVLGISTASFAGSSLIKNSKQKKVSFEKKRLRNAVDVAEKEFKEKTKKLEEVEARQNTLAVTQKQVEKVLEAIPETRDGEEPSAEKANAEYRLRVAKLGVKTARNDVVTAGGEVEPAKAALDKAKRKLADRKDLGLLAIATKAKFTDIFHGDEVGDYQYIDLGKVQMFFFTVAILVAYGVAIGGLLQNEDLLLAALGVALPAFSSSMTTLLGISHAGYLTVKSPDREKTAQLPAQEAEE